MYKEIDLKKTFTVAFLIYIEHSIEFIVNYVG